MNRFILALLISAILALIAYSVFHTPCPPAHQIIVQWEKNSDDYHAGKMSFDELIRQSDKFIECSQKRCKRKTHTVPCQYHRHLHVTVGRGPVPRHA